ncbi:MAG TPA: FAD-binding oxidoreductase [Acidimicrobiales bacterium]|nr:FAD-binding oxidoreductase [Acidimicrobiales bacterium]
MSRRRLLHAGAMGSLAALAAACGAGRHNAGGTTSSSSTSEPATTAAGTSTTTSSTSVATTSTVPTATTTTAVTTTTTTTTVVPTTVVTAPTAADWKALAAGLTGRLSMPGDPTYPVDLELYDPVYDSIHPAGIAYCANPSDVARSIAFAREHGLPLAARSGGHSYAGYSTTTGLVIDVTLMSQVAVTGNVASVGAGTRLIDVYSGLPPHGVSLPGGSCPSVGIAGLALGGGIGVLGRLHGLTSDNIVGLKLVTADGRTVDANATTNPDLFWACRGGGGGNFGVVTMFQFSTFPLGQVSLFGLRWPWAAAAQVLPAWLEWASSQPDPMWSNCLLTTAPGAATVRVGGVWAGDVADARAQVAALLRAVGPPASQAYGQHDYEEAMYIEAGCRGLTQAACHLAGKSPGGTLPRTVTLAKSDILNGPLGNSGVQAVVAGIEERQSQQGPGAVAYDSWGGAINRVPANATAFVHRKALASAQYDASFSPDVAPAKLQQAEAWLNSWYATLRPYVSGEAYQNYIDPSLANWQQAYYGANLPRLKQIKAKWDPDDVFHFAQSLPLP